MRKSKELKKLDKLISDTKKETKSLNIPKGIKKYKVTCQAECKSNRWIKSVHVAKGYNKRLLKKQLLTEIKQMHRGFKGCRIKKNTLFIEEI